EALRRGEGRGLEVRLHRQRLRPSPREHVLSGLRRGRDQAVRLRHHRLVPRQGQQVQEVRVQARDLRSARADREGESLLQRPVPPLAALAAATPSSKRSTPEPESEADQVRVTSWLVECPGVWTAASAGGVSSTRTVNVWAGSSQPALSVAVNWIVWTPELKVNGSPYGRQVPVP